MFPHSYQSTSRVYSVDVLEEEVFNELLETLEGKKLNENQKRTLRHYLYCQCYFLQQGEAGIRELKQNALKHMQEMNRSGKSVIINSMWRWDETGSHSDH